MALRTRGPSSHRGPLVIVCLWLLIFLIAIIWADTYITTEFWPWPVSTLIFHCLYAISLIPEGKAIFIRPRNREEDVSSAQQNVLHTFITFVHIYRLYLEPHMFDFKMM